MKSSEETPKKMDQLALKSNLGELSGFSGVFKVTPLSEQEQLSLYQILETHKSESSSIEVDVKHLKAITSEVKAINTQAIILHGERIKQAQTLLKEYKEGAFSAWLILTYGNRQTPYNFLQYFEFYQNARLELKEKIDLMPKQAIYTLASRVGPQEKKEALVLEYQGESKQVLLEKIREIFPLQKEDKRSAKPAQSLIKLLEKAKSLTESPGFSSSDAEAKQIKNLIKALQNHA
jgi:hypothetical protein